MNLQARVSKLEASGDNSATITIWSDGKTPEQMSAEIAERTGTATNKRRVLLIGWKQTPEVLAVLPKGSVSIATGVPRAPDRLLKQGKNNAGFISRPPSAEAGNKN